MARTLIAIPAYNAAKFIRRSFDSGVSQTAPVDVLFVDNQSDDGTFEIAQEYESAYPFVKVVRNEANLGRVGNWNRCLDLFMQSASEYVIFLFTGDELMPECIERAEAAFADDPEIGAVVWPYFFVPEKGERYVARDYPGAITLDAATALRESIYRASILGGIVGNSYSRAAIRDYQFSEDYIGKAKFDFDVCKGYKVAFLDRPLGVFNKQYHRTFDSAQVSLWVNFEPGFVSAYGLETSRTELADDEYTDLRDRIVLRTIGKLGDAYGQALEWKMLSAIARRLMGRYVRRAANRVEWAKRRALSILPSRSPS